MRKCHSFYRLALTMNRFPLFSCGSIKYSEEQAFRLVFPFFGLNYTTSHEQIIVLGQSALAFCSQSFHCRERVFHSVPHMHTIHRFLKKFMQSIMFKHSLLKESDCIHISSRELEKTAH